MARFRPIVSLAITACMVWAMVPGTPALARTLNASTPIAAGVGPKGIAIGDVNGDGRKDIVVADFRGNGFKIFIQEPDGTLRAPVTVTLPAMGSISSVKIGDMTGDDVADIVAGDTWDQSVHVYVSQETSLPTHLAYSAPTFIEERTLPGPVSNPFDFAMDDATLNGRADLVIPRYYVTPISSAVFAGDDGGYKFIQQFDPTRDFGTITGVSVGGGGLVSASGQLGGDGFVRTTQNDGDYWFDRAPTNSFNVPERLNGISYFDANSAWAGGDNGQLMRTDNGGYDWTPLKLTGSDGALADDINAVSALSPTIAYVVAGGGQIFRYSSATWGAVEDTRAIGTPLYGVKPVSSANLYVVGAGGFIQKLVKGDSWLNYVAAPPTSDTLRGIDLSSVGAVVVGDGGALFHGATDMLSPFTASTITWPAAPGQNLSAVQFVTPLIGFAVGDNGTILKSTDGGLNWSSPVAVPATFADLKAVRFADSLHGFVGGTSGTILRTSDGGATWSDAIIHYAGSSGGYSADGGGNPYAAIIARIDDDQWPDIGLAGFKSGILMPFYRGPNIFASNPDVQPKLGVTMVDAKSGDFNHDGHGDVVAITYGTAGAAGGTLSMALESSIARLNDAPTQQLPTGVAPQSVAVGDVNGDTYDDVAVVNSYNDGTGGSDDTGTVGVYLQKNGLLQPMREFKVGRQPYGCAIGDVNGDGRGEIVVSNQVDDTIQILSIGDPLAPSVRSTTWPNQASFYKATQGSLVVSSPPDFDGIQGFYYTVDHNPVSVPTSATTTPYESLNGAASVTINPAGLATADGDWYFHVRALDKAVPPRLGATTTYRIGIDTHAPTLPVLASIPSGWQSSSSYTLQWSASTDALSGLANYAVYENGAKVTTVDKTITHVTLDGLHDGANSVGVVAVDNAGNATAQSAGTIKVDSAAPTVSITSPKNGATIGGHPTFTAAPKDGAGISKVVFQVDGRTPVTLTRAPWSINPNLTAIPGGSHVLHVTAYDMLGRSATANSSFWLDNKAPGLKVASVAPTPFFPKLKDGYIDYTYFKFSLGEKAKVTFKVTNSSGATVRSITYTMSSGGHQFAWDGKTNAGAIAPAADYGLRVSAADSLGNTASTSAYGVQIRYYLLKRLASNQVQVIPH